MGPERVLGPPGAFWPLFGIDCSHKQLLARGSFAPSKGLTPCLFVWEKTTIESEANMEMILTKTKKNCCNTETSFS